MGRVISAHCGGQGANQVQTLVKVEGEQGHRDQAWGSRVPDPSTRPPSNKLCTYSHIASLCSNCRSILSSFSTLSAFS